MELTELERGALYWAKDKIKEEVESEEDFQKSYDLKNEESKKISQYILSKKKEHLKALESLLKRV